LKPPLLEILFGYLSPNLSHINPYLHSKGFFIPKKGQKYPLTHFFHLKLF